MSTDRVPHVVVHLNRRFGDAYPTLCRSVTMHVTTPPEFDLDDLFRALNRIDELESDLRSLDWEWQRTARRRLDLMQAPSMQVGDTVQLVSASGNRLAMFEVGEAGWEVRCG